MESGRSAHNRGSVSTFHGKKVLILGLGRFGGGVGVTRFLAKEGAILRVADNASADALKDSIAQLAGYTIDYRLGPHTPDMLDNIDYVVVNPAFAPHHPFIKEIEKRGIIQTTEVNIFFERCKGILIGIIGTNGKETVMRIADDILRTMGKKVVVGGNIGTSLLDMLDTITSDTCVLFELSSFQLHRLTWIHRRPDIAVYCNITPDHIEWHGNLDAYIADKYVALHGQGEHGVAIINVDDPILRRESVRYVEGVRIDVSIHEKTNGVYVLEKRIVGERDGKSIDLSPTDLKIVGNHNLSNAVCAAAIGLYFGADASVIGPVLTHFRGVEHALEYVDCVDGIEFYNDSAATNPDATSAALASFTRPIILIIGGYDKQIDWDGVLSAIAQQVKAVATIGQLTDPFADALHRLNPSLPVHRAHTLDKAFSWCVDNATRGEVVLLSPSTSSYDQYRNLEQRGDEFKKYVTTFSGKEVDNESRSV